MFPIGFNRFKCQRFSLAVFFCSKSILIIILGIPYIAMLNWQLALLMHWLYPPKKVKKAIKTCNNMWLQKKSISQMISFLCWKPWALVIIDIWISNDHQQNNMVIGNERCKICQICFSCVVTMQFITNSRPLLTETLIFLAPPTR